MANNLKKYTIKKGHHYCGVHIRLHTGIETYNCEFRYGKDLWYPKGAVTGKSKICGFTEGIMAVYKHSIMFAWQPNFDREGYINTYVYWHDDNSISYDNNYKWIFLATLPCQINIKGSIIHDTKTLTSVKLNTLGQEYKITIPYNVPDYIIGRYIFPYHGGQNVAPKDEIIFMSQNGQR